MSSDKIITEKRTVDPFTGIKFTGVGRVYITRGDSTSLEVKAPAAILQKAKTEVKNNVLEIGFKFAIFRWLRSLNEMKEIEFHISAPRIDFISSQGAGKILSTNKLKVQDMTLKSTGAGNTEIDIDASTILAKVTGAGNIILKGKTGAQDITITGAGKYEAFDLQSDTAVVHSTGSGQAFVNVGKKLDVSITGVGSVKYKGEPAVESRITGLGKLESGN